MVGHNSFEKEVNKKEKDKKDSPYKNPYKTKQKYNKEQEMTFANKDFVEKVKLWASFYRCYPFMFAKDYIGLNLKLFQKILLFCMFHFNFFMFIASRGLGRLIPL